MPLIENVRHNDLIFYLLVHWKPFTLLLAEAGEADDQQERCLTHADYRRSQSPRGRSRLCPSSARSPSVCCAVAGHGRDVEEISGAGDDNLIISAPYAAADPRVDSEASAGLPGVQS